MGFSNDRFVRTTSCQHKQAAQELWRRLEANGQIYLGAYEGW
jgi:methionyl-tRNA synthetase